jgi:hypothetical protein
MWWDDFRACGGVDDGGDIEDLEGGQCNALKRLIKK